MIIIIIIKIIIIVIITTLKTMIIIDQFFVSWCNHLIFFINVMYMHQKRMWIICFTLSLEMS